MTTATTQPAPPPVPAGSAPALAWVLALTVLALWAVGALAALGWLAPSLLPPASALVCIAAPGGLIARRLSRGQQAALLGAGLSLLVATASLRPMTAPDTQPASEQPWALLRHGAMLLDDTPVLRAHPHAHWIFTRPDGHRVSWYPPGMALLALPVYLPAALAAAPTEELLSQFEKTAASLLSACTVLLLGLALSRAGASPRWVLIGCLLAGLGSSHLSLLSQALWQQTGCALGVALLLFAALEPRAASSRLAALCAALILAMCRPPDLLLLAPFLWAANHKDSCLVDDRDRCIGDHKDNHKDNCLYGSDRRFPLALPALAGVTLGGLVFLAYNKFAFGSFFTVGYRIGQGQLGFTLHEFPESTIGLLVSPGHGLLVFLPWLLVLPAALGAVKRERAVQAALASALILIALMSFWWCWWSADSFGPRMLAEVQAPLAFALARGGEQLSRRARRALAVLGALAFMTHAANVYWLAADARFDATGPWRLAAHPLGHLLFVVWK